MASQSETAPATKESTVSRVPHPSKAWPPVLRLWKSRLPLIVVPVLAGLRQLSYRDEDTWAATPRFADDLMRLSLWGPTLLVVIAVGTGYSKLPFSVTWWLVLLAAFALRTQLLLGVAAVLSLSVLLGWYGLRLYHPQAVCALWGGASVGDDDMTAVARALWQVWDLFVHALPAILVLYWHGPSGTHRSAGTVTPAAAMMALPLNVLWIWGLGMSVSTKAKGNHWSRLWPWGLQLSGTNVVYKIEPALPDSAWRWIYGSHWLACGIWAVSLLLAQAAPSIFSLAKVAVDSSAMAEMLVVHGIFVVFGLTQQPFTNAWWTIFLLALYSRGTAPFLEGMCWCTAATTAIGWYGVQVLVPYVFKVLVQVWGLRPVLRWTPHFVSLRIKRFSDTWMFIVVARIGDSLLHFVPTVTAVCMFRHRITSSVALASLPANLIYLAATGVKSLGDTNRMYGIEPAPPGYVWNFVYASHWCFCIAVFCVCLALGR